MSRSSLTRAPVCLRHDTFNLALIPPARADSYTTLWKCPPVNNVQRWWCGHGTVCQEGSTNASDSIGYFFNDVPGASIKTVLPSASNGVLASATGAGHDTSASPSSGNGGSKTPLAIGLGIGIPLSVATGAFIGFLCWRERRKGPKAKEMPNEHSSSVEKPLPPLRLGLETLDHHVPREMQASPKQTEMPANRTDFYHELGGSERTLA